MRPGGQTFMEQVICPSIDQWVVVGNWHCCASISVRNIYQHAHCTPRIDITPQQVSLAIIRVVKLLKRHCRYRI